MLNPLQEGVKSLLTKMNNIIPYSIVDFAEIMT